jgi:predicted MFS family arabinose efflux permease
MSDFSIKAQSQDPTQEKSIMPWVIWGLACLFYFYECLLQVSPSVMSNELMHDFGVTSQTLGILAGIYFYSYAAMQLPCGVLMDHFGPHRILTLATALCALSTIAFGMTHSFYMASVARLMIGMGSAFAVVGILKLAANWFPAQRFALLTGVMVTIGMVGAIFGEAPLALLISRFGWRDSMLIMGVVGLVLALLILLFIKDAPKNAVIHQHIDSDDNHILRSLLALIKNKQLWLIACYGGLMYFADYGVYLS